MKYEMKGLNRGRGFGNVALVWLIGCLAVGGVLLAKGLTTSEEPVHTHFNTKAIEDVKAGDQVWAYDTKSATWNAKEVLKPLVHQYSGDLVTVTVAGHSVEATGNHPFWVVGGEGLSQRPEPRDVPDFELHPIGAKGRWVDARHLEAGDLLVLRDGRPAPIEMVTVRQASTTVYNIQVADLHTYAVGDLGIAVHNKPCFPPGTLVLMGDGSTKPIEKVKLGDWVLSRDPTTFACAVPEQVTCLIRDYAEGLVHVKFRSPDDGTRTVISTRFHPFWTHNRGWTVAKDLSAGDVLEDATGSGMPITGTRIERIIGKSYNLTVNRLHSYFVVTNGTSILVHNADISWNQAAAGLNTNSAGNTTIFRVVGPEELNGIQSLGGYSASPGGLESKYFYPTPQQAGSYASQPFNAPGGPYTLTSTQAPPGVMQNADITPVATEGNVITIPNEYLPQLSSPSIYDTIPLAHS